MPGSKSSTGISYVCIAVTRMPDTNYGRRKGDVGSEFQIIPSIVSGKAWWVFPRQQRGMEVLT